MERSGTFIATLHSERATDIPCLTNILNRCCVETAGSHAFSWASKIEDRKAYREAARAVLSQDNMSVADKEALAVFAALTSDLTTDRKGSLQSTLFDLTSGNQRFLTSILDMSEEFTEEAVREALLGPWQYRDNQHSLGWDPRTQRLHALRSKLPEKDKSKRSVRAAVFLAAQALPLFPCFVRGTKLYTTGFYQDSEEDWFSWPIWCDGITRETLYSLLVHPFSSDLKKRGVDVVYHCRRTRTGGAEGNYQIFSNSSERVWPRSRVVRNSRMIL
jgi:hypothetical protein